ncbi:hypothetical protein G7Y89_g8512 [Cudoniella acicularis]|uniref:Calponin-homology (CH) domain-containing protein n=1 Tax=Cudoniella acicularis TaxID=354080 RepID=A0A8H4RJ86_9HELO|nr:hypothetical protein G7Y89_g8512 [Cudoniella acicularis]
MSYTREEDALLKWVNTFPIDYSVETVADLTDGRILNRILEEFNPQYAVRDLDKNTATTKWLSNKQSLESIYKALNRYVGECCPEVDVTNVATPDFSSIAEKDDPKETAKFLILFLLAAFNGPNPSKYNEMTERLDLEAKDTIQVMSRGLQAMLLKPESANANDSGTLSTGNGDEILELEEKLARTNKELADMKKRSADLQTRNDHLNIKNDDLKEQLHKVTLEKEALEKSHGGDHTGVINDLKKRIRDDENLIERQEQQLDDDRVLKANQERELRDLRPAAQALLSLQDEYQVLKAQKEELSKKANTADNFKKQIESLSDVKETNTRLREQIDTLESNQKDYDEKTLENQKLRASETLSRQKYHTALEANNVMTSELNLFRQQNRELTDQINVLKHQINKDEEIINSLQEDKHINNSFPSPGSPPSPSMRAAPLNLQEELERSNEHTNYPLKIQRLETELALLKSNTAGTTNTNLRLDLDESDRAKKRLEENLQELEEKYIIGQNQLDALISKLANEKLVSVLNLGDYTLLTNEFNRDEAIATTRKAYQETKSELVLTKAKLAEAETELTKVTRELLAARADLSAIDQEEMVALENLKATNESITTSLQSDLLSLQAKLKNSTIDYEQQRTHLVKVLLEKDELRQDLEALRVGGNVKAAEGNDPSQSAIQSSKEQQIEKQEKVIKDLQRRIKIAEEGGADAN